MIFVENKKISILLIGDEKVGKTLLKQKFQCKVLKELNFYDTETKSEHTFIRNEENDKNDSTTEIIEMNEPDCLPILFEKRKCINGAILVCDTQSRTSFLNLNKWIESLKKCVYLSNLPIIQVNNKIDGQRVVLVEEIRQFAIAYARKIVDTSAITGEGVKEAFNSIIRLVYGSLDGIFSIKVEKLYPYLTDTKELKNLLSNLYKEKDQTKAEKIIWDVYNRLKDTQELTKCDIKYQKYLSVLFMKINMIKKEETRNKLNIEIFLHLRRIFSDLTEYLYYNQKDNVIKQIHTIREQYQRIKYYNLYTNQITSFVNCKCNDIIQMYNFLFSVFLINQRCATFSFFKELSQIIITLCSFIKDDNSNSKAKIGRAYDSPYIVTIVESFIDFFIFDIIKLIIDITNYEGHGVSLEKILPILNSVLSAYINLEKIVNILDSALLFKIIGFYCICYYSYGSGEIDFVSQLFALFNSKKSFLISTLFEVIFSINSPNIIKSKFSKPIYLSYFKVVLNQENEEYHKLLNWSILRNYDDYMSNINKLELFQSCLAFLSNIYMNYQSTIKIDDSKYQPIEILKAFQITNVKEKKIGYHSLLVYLDSFTQVKSQNFKSEEWKT